MLGERERKRRQDFLCCGVHSLAQFTRCTCVCASGIRTRERSGESERPRGLSLGGEKAAASKAEPQGGARESRQPACLTEELFSPFVSRFVLQIPTQRFLSLSLSLLQRSQKPVSEHGLCSVFAREDDVAVCRPASPARGPLACKRKTRAPGAVSDNKKRLALRDLRIKRNRFVDRARHAWRSIT